MTTNDGMEKKTKNIKKKKKKTVDNIFQFGIPTARGATGTKEAGIISGVLSRRDTMILSR